MPAIGGFNTRLLQGTKEPQLPPSPVTPHPVEPPATTPPFVKTYEIDPENLRPRVVEDLGAVEEVWWLLGSESFTPGDEAQGAEPVDVLDVMRTTTHAVRSVRNYLMSLPDDSVSPVQMRFRPSLLSSSPVPRR